MYKHLKILSKYDSQPLQRPSCLMQVTDNWMNICSEFFPAPIITEVRDLSSPGSRRNIVTEIDWMIGSLTRLLKGIF